MGFGSNPLILNIIYIIKDKNMKNIDKSKKKTSYIYHKLFFIDLIFLCYNIYNIYFLQNIKNNKLYINRLFKNVDIFSLNKIIMPFSDISFYLNSKYRTKINLKKTIKKMKGKKL